MGLEDTRHIGRIVDPSRPNPDIVYVAAVGHLWGPNAERGVFKTTDGGADVEEGALRRRQHRRDRHRDRSRGSADAVRGDVSASAQGVGLQRRRPGQRHLPHDRWRRDVDEAHERLADRRQGRIGLDIFRERPDDRLRDRSKRPGRDERASIAAPTAATTWEQLVVAQHAAELLHPDPHRPERPQPRLHARIQPRLLLLRRRRQDVQRGVQHRPLGRSRAVDRSRRREPPDRRRRRRRVDLVGPRRDVGCSATTCRSASSTRSTSTCRVRSRVCGGLQDNGLWCVPSAMRNRNGIADRDALEHRRRRRLPRAHRSGEPRIVVIESQNGTRERQHETLERQAIAPVARRERPRAAAAASASAGTGTRRS